MAKPTASPDARVNELADQVLQLFPYRPAERAARRHQFLEGLNDSAELWEAAARKLVQTQPALAALEPTLLEHLGGWSRRQEVLARDYRNQPVQVTLEDVEAATGFFRAVRQLANDRAIGRRSPSVVAPGGRELERFMHTLAVTHDLDAALGQLDIYCDSGPNHKEQWELVREQAKLFYGADGQARTRPAPVQV